MNRRRTTALCSSSTSSNRILDSSTSVVFPREFQRNRVRSRCSEAILSTDTRVDRRNWSSRIRQELPDGASLSDRVEPLRRAISFACEYQLGTSDVKDALSDHNVLQLIMQHLHVNGLLSALKTLEEEAGVVYVPRGSSSSLLWRHVCNAVRRSDTVLRRIMEGPGHPADAELDRVLLELGLDVADDSEGQRDMNLWEELTSESEQRVHAVMEVNKETKKQAILSASLNKLVEVLTDAEGVDLKYVKSFLLTYQSFVSPSGLLAKLIQRFHVPRNAFPNDIDDAEYEENTMKIQLRVCNVLKNWLDHYFSHFSPTLLTRVVSFLEDSVSRTPKFRGIAGKLLSIVTRKMSGDVEDVEFQHLSKAPQARIPSNIFSATLDIDDIDEEEIARQMTLICFEHFRRIESPELLDQAWAKAKLRHRAPNVLMLSRHFNETSLYMASLIVCAPSQEMRRYRYIRSVRIAQYLRQFNNFCSLQIVLSALQNNAVYRMKRLRDSIPPDVIDNLKVVLNEMSPKDNWKIYRSLLRSAAPPCIPYVGQYQGDLTFIDDGNPNVLEVKGRKLINWAKRELTAQVILEMQSYQEIPYNFKHVPQITSLLERMKGKCVDDEELFRISEEVE